MIESIIIFMYPSLTLLRGPLGFLEKEPRLAWPSHLSLLILLAWDIHPSFVKRMSGQDIMKAWLSLLFHLQTYFLKCIPTRNPSQLHPSENNSLRLWGLPPPLPLTLIACKPAVVGSEKSELSVLGAQFPATSTTWKCMILLFQTQGKKRYHSEYKTRKLSLPSPVSFLAVPVLFVLLSLWLKKLNLNYQQRFCHSSLYCIMTISN